MLRWLVVAAAAVVVLVLGFVVGRSTVAVVEHPRPLAMVMVDPVVRCRHWRRCSTVSSTTTVTSPTTVTVPTVTNPPVTSSTVPTSSSSTTTVSSTTSVPADGWRNVVSSDFGVDGVLPAPWYPYNFGNPYGHGWYLPSHVVVAGGTLSLVQGYEPTGPARTLDYEADGGGWYSATIYAAYTADSVDHRVTTRMRVVSTGGVHSHHNMPLWWPNSEKWPVDGEEDFQEGDGLGGRYSFFHYGTNNSFAYWGWPNIDLSQWHTFRMQRLNHKVTIWVDDLVTPVFSQQYTAVELPDTVKHPVFQQENAGQTPPVGTTGSEQVQFDWINVDVPAG